MCWFTLVVLICIVHAEPEVTPTTTELVPKLATQVPALIRIIDEFKTLAHEVSSGKIMVLENNTLEIPNFHFDGKAPQTFFLVGKGSEVSENGTFVYLDDSRSPLPHYDGKSVTLTLPEGLTIEDIDWLAVWCVEYHENLGYVMIDKKASMFPPQTFSLKNVVTSGPVVLVNKKTLFVPSFRYNGDHSDVHFWVGNGSEPSSEGVLVPDETGSVDNLHSYQGQNLYLQLPSGVSTDNIEYFGVWSKDEGVSLGFVQIKGIEGIPDVPKVEEDTSGRFTMRLPKCCPNGALLTPSGCVDSPDASFEPEFNVYEHNETHFSNESLDLEFIVFEPYNSAPVCSSGKKYPLDEENEEFALLKNTSLLLKSSALSGILSTDKFCIDNIKMDNNTRMKILICAPEYEIQTAMFIAYIAITLISTLCFATAFFFYFFWLKVVDVHKECFTVYVFTMTMTFLALSIVQVANIEDAGCKVLGFGLEIFIIASFTLLAILCIDIYIIIKYIDEKKFAKQRKLWYLVVGLGVPILFLIISLARNLTPDIPNSFFKPQYLSNNCEFEAEEQRTIIFYIPIFLSIIVSAVFLALTKLWILSNDRNKQSDYFWLEKGKIYKFMWRKHLIIFVTSVLWSLEALIHMFFASSSMLIAIDVVEASQGILVLLLFVVNKDARTQIVNSIKARKRKKNAELAALEEEIMLT